MSNAFPCTAIAAALMAAACGAEPYVASTTEALAAAPGMAGLAGTAVAAAPASRVVFSAPWGTAPGEMGIERGETAWPGPMSFAFEPGGNVVVVDTVNARLQRFSRAGALLGVVPLGEGVAEDVAVAPDGALFVLRYRRGDPAAARPPGWDVLHVPAGAAETDGSVGVAVPLPTGLFAVPDGVFVESRHATLHRVVDATGAPVPPEAQLEEAALGRPSRAAPDRFWAASKRGDRVDLVARDVAFAVTGKASVAAGGALLSLFELDTDAAGNVYAGLYVDERAEVVVVGADGAERARVPVAPVRYTDARRFVATRADGALFELRTDETGVRLVEHVWGHP